MVIVALVVEVVGVFWLVDGASIADDFRLVQIKLIRNLEEEKGHRTFYALRRAIYEYV